MCKRKPNHKQLPAEPNGQSISYLIWLDTGTSPFEPDHLILPENFWVRSDNWCSLDSHSIGSAALTLRLWLAGNGGEEAGVVEYGDYFFDLAF